MISVIDALAIHEQVLKHSGGGTGIRDIGTLESALSRPFQTFGGVDLYPDILQKAAALMESLIVNHPFIDGNKRTGFTMGNIFLMEHGVEIEGDDIVIYEAIVAIASGEMHFDEILAWLKQNTHPL